LKKAILIFAALLMVVSGVAAVSAYEAHAVNVKATVENALEVALTSEDEASGGLHFGTVFPEEWLSKHFFVQRSSSFIAQSRVDSVDFEVWAEHKVLSDNGTPEDPSDDTYYPWLGQAVYVKINGTGGYLGPDPGAPKQARRVMDYSGGPAGVPLVGTINGTATQAQVYVYLDVPVFFDYYNGLTDVPDKPREPWADDQLAGYLDTTPAAIIDVPSQILPTGLGPGAYEMGVEVKIQVVGIYKE
jgi:hypothetical protein